MAKKETWSEHLARDKAEMDATPAPDGIWCQSSSRGLHRKMMSFTELYVPDGRSPMEWVDYLNRLEARQNPQAQDAYTYLYKEFHKQRKTLEFTAQHLADALEENRRLREAIPAVVEEPAE